MILLNNQNIDIVKRDRLIFAKKTLTFGDEISKLEAEKIPNETTKNSTGFSIDFKNASLIFVSEKLKINEVFLIISFLIRFLDPIKKISMARQVNRFDRRKPKNEISSIKLSFSKILFKISISNYFVKNSNRILIFKPLLY